MSKPKDPAAVEHGRHLKAAMSRQGLDRMVIADATGVQTRTVTNWRNGTTMPSPREHDALHGLLGAYDASGDPVEAAILNSSLTEDRQHEVLATYKRALRSQATDEAS